MAASSPSAAQWVPSYYCRGSAALVDGRGARHISVGGQAIDAAVTAAFVAALARAASPEGCLAKAVRAAELDAENGTVNRVPARRRGGVGLRGNDATGWQIWR